jgi:NADH dehydrogenase
MWNRRTNNKGTESEITTTSDNITQVDTKKPFHSSKHILILGSGFAGVEVLKRLQRKFKNNNSIDITLVSRDNFLLFTPMLPEVASGMIETRHIVTPIRSFCTKANFYEASVESIDLDNHEVVIKHAIGKQSKPSAWNQHTLEYDYLVIALGSKTKFFGMTEIEKHSFTMKSIADAIILRNHVINILEQASIEQANKHVRKSLLTIVIVGGGFNGIETVGELNDFVRDTIKGFYKNIYMSDVRVILVNSSDKILEQVDEELGKYALQKLKDKGVEFIMNKHVVAATPNSAKLDDGTVIPCYTIIWTAGVTPSRLIANLPCDHDKGHRIIANNYLEVPQHPRVYALGDCASITDSKTGKPYPPTAQHAIRQGKVAAKNFILTIEGKEDKKKKFNYKTRGMMAEIGKRTGVATLFGFKLHGFLAWWLWRTFYLSNLPTIKKKMKVMGDWTMDLVYESDVSMIKKFMEEQEEEENKELKENDDTKNKHAGVDSRIKKAKAQ